MKLGYEITKIHKVIEFKQSQWLMPYIDMNTTYRQQKGISKFLKDFYKLLNNSIYGKTNENVLGRTAIELEKNDVIAIKKMSKENFRSGCYWMICFLLRAMLIQCITIDPVISVMRF